MSGGWLLLLYIVGLILPYFYLLRMSFNTYDPMLIFRETFVLANYIKVLTDTSIGGLLIAVTDPFEKLAGPHMLSDGNGLNPLLQHPVMMIHPIMLYIGFTGFAVPYSFALAALITGELGTNWFRTTRRWTRPGGSGFGC